MGKVIRVTAHQHASIPTYETFKGGDHKYRLQTGVKDIDNEIQLCVEVDEGNFNVVAGTALKRIFDWLELYKDCNVRNGVRASIPLDLKFEVLNEFNRPETMLFDTSTAGKVTGETMLFERLRQKLKVGAAAKSQRAFGHAFHRLFKFANTPMQIVNLNELLTDLDIKVALETDTKNYSKWLETHAN